MDNEARISQIEEDIAVLSIAVSLIIGVIQIIISLVK